jgi:phenylacetate-CoA ligase
MKLPVRRRYHDYRLETLPRDELERRQFARLKAVLDRAYHQSRFYRRLFDDAKVHPDQIKSWEDFHGRVPLIDKRTLLADQAEEPPWGRKLMVPAEDIRKVYITSGTSGVGQEVHPMTEQDFRIASEVGFFCFAWAGMEKGDLNALFWPLATMAGGQVAHAGLERFGANVMALGLFDSSTKIRRLREFRHHYIWATPVYLTRLTHLCRETDMRPAVELPNLKGIVLSTGAFPLEWAQEMEEFWGTRLYDCYGSTQIRSIYASTCEKGVADNGRRGSYHPAEPFVVANIVDPATGRPVKYGDEGELVITNLRQDAAPMIRFRQGDRIRRLPHEACDCGRTWEVWEAGTISRYDDMLKIRGQNIWPLAVDEVVFAYREIEEYGGRVWVGPDGTEEVLVSVEFSKETPTADRPRIVERLPEELRRRTGIRMTVAEVEYGTIPRFEYKAIRWTDERQQGLTKVKFTEK